MTGGYGNSYAQSVGQQAYQGYLQQLNEVVPQLYQMAYDQYNQEGQNMLNQYSLLAAQDEQDYGRYRDEVGDYYTLLQQAFDRYDTERDYDYSKWADERDFAYGEFSDDRAYDYQEERDQVADDQWQAEYDEAVRQWNQEYEAAYGDTSGGSGSGNSGNGGNGGNGGGGGNYDQDTADVQQMLKDAGYDIAVDGVWGPKTQAAYDDYYGESGGTPEGAEEYTLSDAAKEFMSHLPYAHAGSSAEAWKNVVEDRLIAQYENGMLSEEDVAALIEELGLDK